MPLTDLHEPDRRIDTLIDYIEADGDTALRTWAVEALAGGLGVDAVVAEGDTPDARLRALGEALGGRVALALALAPEDADKLVRAALEGYLRGLRAP